MRKICFVTATRAEYFLLKPLMEAVQNDSNLQLQLIVTGAHLDQNFGYTLRDIENDFSDIDAKIPFKLSDDKKVLSKSMGDLQIALTDVFSDLSPDIIVILGDRYEMLSVASTALMLQIPIAHIHGGEVTQGAIDDAIRHAITKLSHLHFTSTEAYAKRVIQLGENPSRIFDVGSLGVENIKHISLLSKEELQKSINFSLDNQTVLITYHPQTLSDLAPTQQFQGLLNALDRFKELKIIFTKANADVGGQGINEMIDQYVKENSHKAIAFTSLGQLRYFSAIKAVNAVVGNSSSGIIEVPSFHTPTVNIGERQKGRVQAASVINCSTLKESIVSAINKALDPKFQTVLKDITNPYEGNTPTQDIIAELKSCNLQTLLNKEFYDL
ncbi:MAG: UDP-N-acetylglucosamine 2-epimerase [Sulfurimonas sp.]